MAAPDVKSELKQLADQLPASASYADAMYALYVRMKVARGREAAAAGHVTPHEDIKRRFVR
ncbi:MAG: hypothetical protein GC162_20735 [Planctomycetes bacterium]|nr:hypothetical protein [Planctomycetota bacterium]